MLPDLITSFWAQDLAEAELVIQDDASPDGTQPFMESVAALDDRIVYARNEQNVGLSENTLRALRLARGSCIVLLGDDDILLGPHALGTYVSAFAMNPRVHFVYPNQIQMDRLLNFDIAYRHFNVGERYDSGQPSFRNMWLKSIQTAGVGLRQSTELLDLYPRSTLLFPQVELVGRLLCRYESCGIPDFLVGVRSHSDQLGFHANRGKRIVGPEKHGTIEILDIAARIIAEEGLGPDVDYTAKVLAHALATNLPNEKVHGSTRIIVSNVLRLMQSSKVARRDPLLLLSLLITASTPPGLLDWLRGSAKGVVRRRQIRDAEWFSSELDRQRKSGAERWGNLEDKRSPRSAEN
jgi:glycosyl transferase family 2